MTFHQNSDSSSQPAFFRVLSNSRPRKKTVPNQDTQRKPLRAEWVEENGELACRWVAD